MRRLFLLLLLCLLIGSALDAHAMECSEVMTLIDDVPARFNGSYQGTSHACFDDVHEGTYGWQWHCVELVKRFHNRADWSGDGGTYFGTATTKGLDAYQSGGRSEWPLHGDILGFSGGGHGHVALVDRVYSDGDHHYLVEIVEQNWSDTTGRRLLGMTRNGNNTLTIAGGGYSVQGWLRYPPYFNPAIQPAIAAEFSSNGGATNFGILQSPGSGPDGIHWYHAYNWENLYRGGNVPNNCYVQNWAGGQYGFCGIVFDLLGGATRAYTVRTGFWQNDQHNGWAEPCGPNDPPGLGGPMNAIGMPVTNEYSTGSGVSRQDFVGGWLNWIYGTCGIHVWTHCAPGWTTNGWDPAVSYRIANIYGEYHPGYNPSTYYGDPSGAAYRIPDGWRQDFQYHGPIDVLDDYPVGAASVALGLRSVVLFTQFGCSFPCPVSDQPHILLTFLAPTPMASAPVWALYARVYDTINENLPYVRMLDEILGALALPPRAVGPLEILDAGCGTGNAVLRLLHSGTDVRLLGIDSSLSMLARARAKCRLETRARFQPVDLDERLPFDDSTYDRIVSINALYAVAKPLDTLREIFRVLKPGGRLVLASPTPDSSFFGIMRGQYLALGSWRFALAFLRRLPALLVIMFVNLVYLRNNANYWDEGATERNLRAIGFREITIRRTYADQDLLVTCLK